MQLYGEYIKPTDWDNINQKLSKLCSNYFAFLHFYLLLGSHVLSSFKETTEFSNKKKTLIDFGEVVKGQKGKEVARFFLSSLMPAKAENVQISTKAGTDPQLVKKVKLVLLSVISYIYPAIPRH